MLFLLFLYGFFWFSQHIKNQFISNFEQYIYFDYCEQITSLITSASHGVWTTTTAITRLNLKILKKNVIPIHLWTKYGWCIVKVLELSISCQTAVCLQLRPYQRLCKNDAIFRGIL